MPVVVKVAQHHQSSRRRRSSPRVATSLANRIKRQPKQQRLQRPWRPNSSSSSSNNSSKWPCASITSSRWLSAALLLGTKEPLWPSISRLTTTLPTSSSSNSNKSGYNSNSSRCSNSSSKFLMVKAASNNKLGDSLHKLTISRHHSK